MSDIAISIKNVSKYYKLYDNPKDRLKEALNRKGKQYHHKFYATKNLNLEIKKGEIIGIVGKNGSGKSTLLKLITGVLQPDEGNITVNGQISALLELGSGFNPEFTGMQNIFFYGTVIGFSKEEMQAKLDDILAFADIGEFIHQPLKTYSSGMKSRLGFAVAVHIDPEILILDEVLSVGDVLFKRKCYAKMEEFFKGGKTILYVSHDANSVNQLCTRAIFLDQGSILLDSDANTVTKYYQKYIFAKDTVNIRNEILQVKENIDTKETPDSNTLNIKNDTNTSEYFIPNFIPKSTVEYQNYEVTISNPIIRNSENEIVNVLKQNNTYTYSHRIKFDIDLHNISLGMQIKNDKGFLITGSSLSQFDKELPFVKKNTTYEVSWSFDCNLLPATYYLNSGSSALIDGERVYLHRVVDIACFKVISSHPTRYGGIVHLNQTPSIRIIND